MRAPLLLGLAAAAAACGQTTALPDAGPGDSFDRAALISHLGGEVILGTYEAFAASADALRAALEGACDSEEARAAWREAMLLWERAEIMRVGPLAMDGGALRDQIYSWDVVSSCAVDRAVADEWSSPGAISMGDQLTNRRGLDALEYLLFAPTLEHSCSSQAAPAGWDALPESERREARCSYANLAAVDLVASADSLVARWRGEGGYLEELARAGAGSAEFEDQRDALSVLSIGLFYVDASLKDMKLQQPAGLTLNSCNTIGEPCPAELESRWADISKENMLANLEGFAMMYRGDVRPGEAGLGFDDLLEAVGAGELAAEMNAALDASIAAMEAVDGPLSAALESDYGDVVAAADAVQRLVDLLKSQFLTVLGFELPDEISDND